MAIVIIVLVVLVATALTWPTLDDHGCTCRRGELVVPDPACPSTGPHWRHP